MAAQTPAVVMDKYVTVRDVALSASVANNILLPLAVPDSRNSVGAIQIARSSPRQPPNLD